MTAVLDEIAVQRVIPVVRADSRADAVATARAVARAGMRVVELTCSVPDVEGALDDLRDAGLTLGLGTITDARQVEVAAAAGARFAVSFGNPAGFVPRARLLRVTAVPGALSPTEFAACAALRADAVKLFPARLPGPRYLRDLAAVLPGLRVLATGGIGAGEITAWLDAGAIAVGLGSELGTAAGVGAREVERRARAALAQAHAAGRRDAA